MSDPSSQAFIRDHLGALLFACVLLSATVIGIRTYYRRRRRDAVTPVDVEKGVRTLEVRRSSIATAMAAMVDRGSFILLDKADIVTATNSDHFIAACLGVTTKSADLLARIEQESAQRNVPPSPGPPSLPPPSPRCELGGMEGSWV